MDSYLMNWGKVTRKTSHNFLNYLNFYCPPFVQYHKFYWFLFGIPFSFIARQSFFLFYSTHPSYFIKPTPLDYIITTKYLLCPGIDVETGDVIGCLVIDIDTKEWLFIATLIPEVIQLLDSDKTSKRTVLFCCCIDSYKFCLVWYAHCSVLKHFQNHSKFSASLMILYAEIQDRLDQDYGWCQVIILWSGDYATIKNPCKMIPQWSAK